MLNDCKQDLRKEYLEKGFDAYVLFTLSGKEEDLADELNGKYEDCYCLVLKRMVHRSRNGVKWDEEDVLIKGYVFIYLEKGSDILKIKSDNNPFRILKKELEYGKLFGFDYDYASWVLELDGIIGVSKAVLVGTMVKIIEGPLSQLSGYIVEYSKRNRNCCVELEFMNQKIKTWLPFEYTDANYKMDEKNGK